MPQRLAQLTMQLAEAIRQNRGRNETVEAYDMYHRRRQMQEALALLSRDCIIEHAEYLLENWEKSRHGASDYNIT